MAKPAHVARRRERKTQHDDFGCRNRQKRTRKDGKEKKANVGEAASVLSHASQSPLRNKPTEPQASSASFKHIRDSFPIITYGPLQDPRLRQWLDALRGMMFRSGKSTNDLAPDIIGPRSPEDTSLWDGETGHPHRSREDFDDDDPLRDVLNGDAEAIPVCQPATPNTLRHRATGFRTLRHMLVRRLQRADCTIKPVNDDTIIIRLQAKRRSLLLIQLLRDAAVALGDADGDHSSVDEDIHVLTLACKRQIRQLRAKRRQVADSKANP